MTSLNQDIAYLVPKSLWERVQVELKQHKGGLNLMNYAEKNKDQSGGALSAIGTQGKVDPSELMKMLAVQMNLNQSPRANFVSHSDQLMKKILNDQSLSDEEKIHYLNSARDAFRSQRTGAVPPIQQQAQPHPQPVVNAPRSRSLPAIPSLSLPRPLQSSPRNTVHRGTPGATAKKIISIEKKMGEIENSPVLTPKQKIGRAHV